MEFRYRAIDGNRPKLATNTTPSPSPNPGFSFFSARPIPGSNMGSSVGQVPEAMKREIEKELIRQEIIVAETARRRELISEVLQEMAIEREIASRRVTGMSLEEKLTMWINLRNNNLFRQVSTYSNPLMQTAPYSLATSPMYTAPYNLVTSPMVMQPPPPLQQMPEANVVNATPVSESNREKLIILERPDDPIEGKGKAVDNTQTSLGSAKRKAGGGVVGGLNEESVQRKKLKSKAIALETGETACSKLPSSLGKLGCEKQVESKDKSFKFWCEVCKVGAYNQTVMRNHEFGKKHQAAIEQQKASTITVPQSESITVVENASVQGQKVDETAAEETGKKTKGEKKKTVTFLCETCNVLTYSEHVMEAHKLGKKHKAMVEKQSKKPLAILDTNIITVPVTSLCADPVDQGSVDQTKGTVHCLD